MARSSWLKKIIFSFVIFILYFAGRKFFYPVLTNDAALKQLEDTQRSFTDYQIYQNLWNVAWVIPLIVIAVMFFPEMKELYYKLRGGYER